MKKNNAREKGDSLQLSHGSILYKASIHRRRRRFGGRRRKEKTFTVVVKKYYIINYFVVETVATLSDIYSYVYINYIKLTGFRVDAMAVSPGNTKIHTHSIPITICTFWGDRGGYWWVVIFFTVTFCCILMTHYLKLFGILYLSQ